MARTLSRIVASAELSGQLLNEITGVTDGGPRTTITQKGAPSAELTSGTSALKADRIVRILNKAVAVGTPWDLDLYDLGTEDSGGGAGRDQLGQLWTIAELVAILVKVSDTSAGSIVVGGEGSTAAFNSILNGSDSAGIGPITAGGVLFLANYTDPAYAVTDATNHLLRFTASGGTATVTVVLLGRSA